MPYKVENTEFPVTLDGAPHQGAEVCVIAADNSQSLGRATTDANGLFSVNVGEYSGEVKVDVYIDGIKPQVKRFMPELIVYTPPPFVRDYPTPSTAIITQIIGGWSVDMGNNSKIATALNTIAPSGSYVFKITSWTPVPSLGEIYIGFTDVDPLASSNTWFFENGISYNPQDSQIRIRGANGGDTIDVGANDNPVLFFVDFDNGTVKIFNATNNSLIVSSTFDIGGFSGANFSMYIQSNNAVIDVVFDKGEMGVLPTEVPNSVKQVGEV